MTRLEYSVKCSGCEPEDYHNKAAVFLKKCCPLEASQEDCYDDCLTCWLKEHKEENDDKT